MTVIVNRSDERTHELRWWVLAVLSLSTLLVTIDNTIVNVALPTLSRELGASSSGLQWIVDGYTLVFAALLLAGGGMGDRYGRRRTLQVGLALFALTSVLASAASTTGELVAARAAMGVAAALIYPATLALLTTTFRDRRERATAIGVWSGVSGLAVALGPLSGGVLLEHFAWGSVFLVNVPLVAAALVAGWALLPESCEHAPGRFDVVGAVNSVAGIGLVVWTVIEAPGHGWTSATTLGGFAATAAILAGFVVWERRAPNPLLDVSLFANPRFSAASASIALAFFGLFGFIFLITQYFQVVRGYSTLLAGCATLPFALTVGVLSPVAIAVVKRIGTTAVVVAGLILMSAGFLVAAGTAVDSAYWGRIVTAMVLMAAGLALTTGPATDAVMSALPAAQAGAGSAVNDTTRELGGTMGVAVVGSVMSSAYGPQVVSGLSGLGVSREAADAASGSVVAGLQVAGATPGAAEVVRAAFMSGLQQGSWAAAAVTAVAAVGAAVLLPRHDRVDGVAHSALPATSSAPPTERARS